MDQTQLGFNAYHDEVIYWLTEDGCDCDETELILEKYSHTIEGFYERFTEEYSHDWSPEECASDLIYMMEEYGEDY